LNLPALRPNPEEIACMVPKLAMVRHIRELPHQVMEGVVEELSQIDAVGHRVVHGGETFAKPALVDGAVIRAIEELSELAVLHNPINLAGIRAVSDLMPGVP